MTDRSNMVRYWPLLDEIRRLVYNTVMNIIRTAAFAPLFVAVCAHASFSDTAGHRFEKEIDHVKNSGIVSGYGDGTYGPDLSINRAEFTKIIVSSLYEEESIRCLDEKTFTDTDENAWYAKYLCTAYREGVIDGNPDGTFRPSASINAAEASKILAVGFRLTLPQYFAPTEWYVPYMDALAGKNAFWQSNVSPSHTLTRGEMAYMISILSEKDTVQNDDRGVCMKTGCSGTVCSDEDVVTTCEWREEYACYQSAVCERQPSGECGWTPSAELQACLGDSSSSWLIDYDEAWVGQRPVVLFFHADWCPYCRSHKEFLAANRTGTTVMMIDYDERSDLVRRHSVTQQDTFILLNADGGEQSRLVFPTQEQLSVLTGIAG